MSLNLGYLIKQARSSLMMTQGDLAKELGCSQPYVSSMESGNLGIIRCEEILDILGFKLDVKLIKKR